MAVVKTIALPTRQYEPDGSVEITDASVNFEVEGDRVIYVNDVDAIDKLQKALAVWVAWKRLCDE